MDPGPVPRTGRRGFRVGDVMMLVAVAAFGLFLCRTALLDYLPPSPKTPLRVDLFSRVRDSLPFAVAFLIPSTIACLILGLRDGRAAPGRGLDSPGLAAAAAATFVVAAQTAATAVLILARTRSDFIGSPLNWGEIPHPGSGVMGLWAVLWLGGRWPAARTWVDRLGLALGTFWVVLTLTCWLSFALIR